MIELTQRTAFYFLQDSITIVGAAAALSLLMNYKLISERFVAVSMWPHGYGYRMSSFY